MIPSNLSSVIDRTGSLGWIPFNLRTRDQIEAHDAALKAMPKFRFTAGATPPVGTKVILSDYWKHERAIKAWGAQFTGTHQLTGSCVWAGGQNVLMTRVAIDIIKKGDFENFILPNGLVNYGRSRLAAGMRGEGEGSLGSTFADSCGKDDGTPDAAITGMPKPTDTSDGWIYGQRAEYLWSNGNASVITDVLPEARKHKCKVTVLRSGEEVRDMILAENPVTTAYGQYISKGQVKQGAVVGNYDGSGGHQTSWLGYWHHPDLGELIWYQNQWGLRQYPSDPGGGPLGGTWQPISSVDRVAKSGDGEVYAFLDHEGYLPPTFSWFV